ncbi:MAG: DUF368 domain-containing protein [Haliscomenobacter sp.]|nr:DUF368 domain-containing protein [Haliscomenobacter sp.]
MLRRTAGLIPGVSGGTIAFITGIYERLLDSIKNVLGPEVFRAWKSRGLRGVWKAVDGEFLLFLLLGMGTGLVSGVFRSPICWSITPAALGVFSLVNHCLPPVCRQAGQKVECHVHFASLFSWHSDCPMVYPVVPGHGTDAPVVCLCFRDYRDPALPRH